MSYDTATQTYRDTHLGKGWTIDAVFRALKRAVARQIFHALTTANAPCPTTPTYGQRDTRKTSPSPPPRSISASGHHASSNSNSDNAPTTNSPNATENASKTLDTQ